MPLDAYLGRPLVRPVIYDTAFDDPEQVRAIIVRNAPYWCVSRDLAPGYGSDTPMRWFHETWKAVDCQKNGRDELLYHQRFIDGARDSFVGFEIVRPRGVAINLMAEESGGPHVDLPEFRGLDPAKLPIWLAMTMNYSELFDRWNINIASALSWLYRGEGGGFAYWEKGPDQQPEVLTPLDNRVLISDNQRMLHGVLPFGDAKRYGQAAFRRSALLHGRADGGWDVVDNGVIVERFDLDQIRISILWTAQVFENTRAAKIQDGHEDDLTINMAIDILVGGAKAKGFDVQRPQDPLNDKVFMGKLVEAFPKPQPRYDGKERAS